MHSVMPTDSKSLPGDELGPARVIQVRHPAGLNAALVIDNVAAGPAIGGLRMAADVTLAECARLARAMTLKNAAAGLRHGGGKSVIAADPRLPAADKQRLIRTFAHALRNESDYIFGPDMGTDEGCMAWVHDEIGRAVGLPAELGGIPLDELGATGWGVRHAAQVACEQLGISLSGATVAVQGFGAVGYHSARFLTEAGATLVAAADSSATAINRSGIDIEALRRHKLATGALAGFAGAQGADRDAVLAVACDLWIPAARPDVIHSDNADSFRGRVMIQGANIPVTGTAEQRLHDRGVLCVPDFIANAGGVICAAMEYAGATRTAAFDAIRERIIDNTRTVLEQARAQQVTPRAAAQQMARQRVEAAMARRRFGNM